MIEFFAVLGLLLLSRGAGFWSYLIHDPSAIDGVSLRSILTHAVWPVALAVSSWFVAWGSGRRALRLARLPSGGAHDELIAAVLGLGVVAQSVFLLGWAGLLRPWPLAVLSLVFAVLAVGPYRRPSWPSARADRLTGCAAGLLAFAAVCALLRALAPPTEWDVRAYHLALPELALKAGGFVPVPWLLHSHWPHLMEALYALPLAVGRDGAAALLHLGAAGLLVGGVFACARRTAGSAAAWTAALLLAAQPAFLREAGTAHSDAAAALFTFAAAGALACWEETGLGSWLAVAGLLAGFGAASKMTLLAALAGWTMWLAFARRRPREAAVFLACGLAVAGPWFLKTWLETGDPVWPWLSRAPEAAALAARNHVSNRWGFPPPLWALTQDGPGFLLIPLAGLWALVGKKVPGPAPLERRLWVPAPFLLLLVLREHGAWRYLMPLWPALALAAGRAASAAFSRGAARAAAATALVVLGAAPIMLASPNNDLFAALAPRPASAPAADRRALWEERSLGLTDFYREARSVLPPTAKVLLFREVRGYGAGFDYVWGDPMNQALLDYRTIPDPDALFDRMRALGITHVLENAQSPLYREDPGYYDRRTLTLMSECLGRRAETLLLRGGFALHRLR